MSRWQHRLALDLFDVDEDPHRDPSRLHRRVERTQYVLRVIEPVARDDHTLFGSFEESPQHHRSVASKHARGPFRPRPHQLGSDGSLRPFSQYGIDDCKAAYLVQARQCFDKDLLLMTNPDPRK